MTHLSMMRAHPPRLERFADTLRSTWKELAESAEGLAPAFQSHRYSGTPEDRAAAVSWIGPRISPPPAIERVMVTNGTMNSILLLSACLVGRGNVILTEELTFPITYRLFDIAAVQVQAVRIDELGIIPEDFEQKCIACRPKAIYLNCTVHSPTAYVTPLERRQRIVDIARRHGVQIFEDEAQALYLNDAPTSFATLAPEITWYLMGLSKYLPPGLRTSFVVGPAKAAVDAILERMSPVTTWHPAPLMATLVTRWISNGHARELLDAARSEVHKRQAIVQDALCALQGFRGSSGLHFWLNAPRGVDSTTFSSALADAGVLARPSHLYSRKGAPRFEGIRPAVGELRDLAETRRAVEIIRNVHGGLTAKSPKCGDSRYSR